MEVEPALVVTCPAGHGVHVPDTAADEYVEIGHCVQSESFLLAMASPTRPAPQAVQLDCASWSVKDPAGQGKTRPAAHAYPKGHFDEHATSVKSAA
jgi:hypothetical protein